LYYIIANFNHQPSKTTSKKQTNKQQQQQKKTQTLNELLDESQRSCFESSLSQC